MTIIEKHHTRSQNEIVQNVLERLSGVVTIGDGWKSLCPAHTDQHPSLNIKIGYKGLLVKCWAGCSLDNIVGALGLQPSDLFFDAPQPRYGKSNGTPERADLDFHWPWRRQTNELENIADSQRMLAEDFLRCVKLVDATTLTDDERGYLLEQIALAMSWVNLASSLDALVFEIRQQMRQVAL